MISKNGVQRALGSLDHKVEGLSSQIAALRRHVVTQRNQLSTQGNQLATQGNQLIKNASLIEAQQAQLTQQGEQLTNVTSMMEHQQVMLSNLFDFVKKNVGPEAREEMVTDFKRGVTVLRKHFNGVATQIAFVDKAREQKGAVEGQDLQIPSLSADGTTSDLVSGQVNILDDQDVVMSAANLSLAESSPGKRPSTTLPTNRELSADKHLPLATNISDGQDLIVDPVVPLTINNQGHASDNTMVLDNTSSGGAAPLAPTTARNA